MSHSKSIVASCLLSALFFGDAIAEGSTSLHAIASPPAASVSPQIEVVHFSQALDRAAWAANASYHVHRHGRVDHLLALRTATKAFEQNPRTNPFEVLASLQRLERDFEGRFRSAKEHHSSTSESATLLSDYLSTASSLLSLGSGFAGGVVAASASAMKVGASLYDSTFGPSFQLPEQLRLARAFESLGENQLHDWTNAWNRAAVDPAFALVLNTFFGPKFQATTNDSARSIHSKNPDYADHVILRELLALGEKTQIDQEKLRALFHSAQSEMGSLLTEIRKRAVDTNRAQGALEGRIGSTAGETDASSLVLLARQRELEKLRAEALRAGWSHLTSILSVVDPKSARILARAGDAAFQVVDALSRFSDTTARFGQLGAGIGTAMATGNVLSATIALTQLLGEGPTTDQLILEQLRDIRLEVQALSASLHDRFDRVDRGLNSIYDSMNQRMVRLETILEENLRQPIVNLQKSVAEVQRHLENLERRLDRIESRLAEMPDLQRRNELFRTWNRCQLELKDSSRSLFRTFKRCSEELETLPGLPVTSSGRSYHDEMLATELAGPLSQNVPYLLNYAWAAAGLRTMSSAASLPDLNDWATRAMGFASIYESQPEFWKVSGGAQLERYLDIGATFSQAMRSSLIVAGPKGPEPDEVLISSLAESYRLKLQTFSQALRRTRHQFEHSEARGHSLTETKKPKWTGPAFLAACASPSLDRRLEFLKLDFPQWAKDAVPDAVQMVEEFEPGTLRLCFEAELVDTRRHVEKKKELHGQICRQVDPGWPDDRHHLPECVLRDLVLTTTLEVRLRAAYQSSGAPETWPVLATLRSDRLEYQRTPEKCHYQLERCLPDGTSIDRLQDLASVVRTQWQQNSTSKASLLSNAAPPTWKQDASTRLTQRFEELRRQFSAHLSAQIRSDVDLKLSLRQLTGAKRLIEGHLFLALPRTLESDDLLQALLRGAEGLPDEELVEWSTQKNPDLFLGDIVQTAESKLETLLQRARVALIRSGGREEHPTVTEVLDQLSALKRKRLAEIPKRPVEEVLDDLRLKIRNLQAN